MPIYKNNADDYTMIHFGQGDLVVSINDEDEVIITPIYKTGPLGDVSNQYNGKATNDIPPGIRIVFDAPKSIEVVMDALVKLMVIKTSAIVKENENLRRFKEEVTATKDAQVPYDANRKPLFEE